MENQNSIPVFSQITAAGQAAKKILFEIVSPYKETNKNKRNFRQYFYKYECCGDFYYKGKKYFLVLRLINDSEPQNENELRIVENPKLTRRAIKARSLNLLEVNPRVTNNKEQLFLLSCIILSHAVHGKGFFPSPSSQKKKAKYYRNFLE
ncbi:MAG: hypothetical protein ACP5QN_01565 [Minisyncoccia bacterium]